MELKHFWNSSSMTESDCTLCHTCSLYFRPPSQDGGLSSRFWSLTHSLCLWLSSFFHLPPPPHILTSSRVLAAGPSPCWASAFPLSHISSLQTVLMIALLSRLFKVTPEMSIKRSRKKMWLNYYSICGLFKHLIVICVSMARDTTHLLRTCCHVRFRDWTKILNLAASTFTHWDSCQIHSKKNKGISGWS